MQHRQTSIEALHRIRTQGLLSKRRFEIYDVLYQCGPATATEIAVNMSGYKSPSKGNNVHARLCEMRERGVVTEVGERRCGISGLNVILWDVTSKLPTQPQENREPTKSQLINSLALLIESAQEGARLARGDSRWNRWLSDSELILEQCKKHRKGKNNERDQKARLDTRFARSPGRAVHDPASEEVASRG